MRILSPEQQAELTHRLNEFSKFSASSAQQISIESDRICQEILMRDQKARREEKIRQETLDVQKDQAKSAKRQADSAESSARTAIIAAWISGGAALISLISLIIFFIRK